MVNGSGKSGCVISFYRCVKKKSFVAGRVDESGEKVAKCVIHTIANPDAVEGCA